MACHRVTLNRAAHSLLCPSLFLAGDGVGVAWGSGGARGGLTLSDFLAPDRRRLSGVLFSSLWNLGKLQAFEARDPYTWKAELNGPPHPSPWARFAATEYLRLASEEEEAAAAAGGGAAGGMDVDGGRGLGGHNGMSLEGLVD